MHRFDDLHRITPIAITLFMFKTRNFHHQIRTLFSACKTKKFEDGERGSMSIKLGQNNDRTTANSGFCLVCTDTQIRTELRVDRA
jgi:hypothetical protein